MKQKTLNRKKLNPHEWVYTGTKTEEESQAQLFQYNADVCREKTNYDISSFKGFEKDEFNYWLNLHGIHDTEKVKQLSKKLNIHNLSIQDILDVNQRPKFQEYESYWFFSIKSILPKIGSGIEEEQLSFILGHNFLVSFQEHKADYFDHIRYRLKNKLGLSRERSTDFLLFLLLESILDNYFKTVSKIENESEKFSLADLDTDPSPESLKLMELQKRQIHHIKKTIIPIKEFVGKIEREEQSFVQQKHMKYYYELKDLCLALIDDCDHIELRLESNSNMFFSIQGHRMNQIMKTLTVVASVFIPLTFIAGIYGMNFNYIPELQWQYGYFAAWAFMIFIFAMMMIYFKRKKWF